MVVNSKDARCLTESQALALTPNPYPKPNPVGVLQCTANIAASVSSGWMAILAVLNALRPLKMRVMEAG